MVIGRVEQQALAGILLERHSVGGYWGDKIPPQLNVSPIDPEATALCRCSFFVREPG